MHGLENVRLKTVITKKLQTVIDSDGTLESIIAGLLNRFGRTESIYSNVDVNRFESNKNASPNPY